MKTIYFISRELVTLPKVSLSALVLTNKGVNVVQSIGGVEGTMFVAKEYIGFVPNTQPIAKKTAKKSTK
jgi:hypothetical protein